jgi:3-hydroxyisobutyrate dehydrogenase-like beta-hydroxyacid dehydrogenase
MRRRKADTPVTETVGFVGLGNMGAPMAERLRAAGYGLVVHDVRDDVMRAWEEKGAKCAASPADVGSRVQVAFVSVPTPDIVEAVADGLRDGEMLTHVVDLSTTGPEAAARAAKALNDAGKAWVDCPVSGGVAGARAGTLALMVGAGAADLARVAPMLAIFGKVYHVGEKPGMGQTMKLVNNLLSAAALALSSEGVALAVKAGLDAETVVSVLNAGSGRNSATLDKFPRQILTRTFDAGFSMGLMLKDVELCLRQAEALDLSVPASERVRQIWREATAAIGRDQDFTKIATHVEKRAGVTMGKKG